MLGGWAPRLRILVGLCAPCSWQLHFRPANCQEPVSGEGRADSHSLQEKVTSPSEM